MIHRHTDSRYERQINELKDLILRMGTRVNQTIEKSMHALIYENKKNAQEVVDGDAEINQMEVEVDRYCIELIALHQPAAIDLRLMVVGLKISNDLERMGDLAVNICERVLEMETVSKLIAQIEIEKMSGYVLGMIQDALRAYVHLDAKLAVEVCQRDAQVDAAHHKNVKYIMELMVQNPDQAVINTGLFSISKYMERLADHATNIAEKVVFLIDGRDIRHHYLG